MNLEFSKEDAAFRDEVRAFIASNLTPELQAAGKLSTSVFTDKPYALGWQRILHKKGWAAPAWPVEYGGTGWNEMQRYIFASECVRAQTPGLSPMGLRMCAPVLMKFGAPEQKSFYLPRILAGEDYWCQGYSEPGSGSDLSSLQLRAVPDGDDYVLNGTKIWTTHAHFANRMFCLVRTDNSGRQQEGISFLLLEMNSPGIKVEPIITLAGEHEVNQVFFDDVRVPKANLVGEENKGWTVAKYLLEFERGGAYAAGLAVQLEKIRAIAASERAGDGQALDQDPAFARRLAEIAIEVKAVEITEHRVMSTISKGGNPGPASSMLKIRGTETQQKIDEIATEILGWSVFPDQLAAREPGVNIAPVGPEYGLTIVPRYLNNRAASIYGGSNEIQRGIIAKLVLGL